MQAIIRDWLRTAISWAVLHDDDESETMVAAPANALKSAAFWVTLNSCAIAKPTPIALNRNTTIEAIANVKMDAEPSSREFDITAKLIRLMQMNALLDQRCNET